MKELFVKHNSIGFIIKIVGLVVLVWGFFQGILISTQFTQQNMGEWEVAGPVGGFSLFSFLSILFTHAIYGILIIGFGEVIDLLQKIYDQKSPKPVLPDPVRHQSYTFEQRARNKSLLLENERKGRICFTNEVTRCI